MNFPNIQEHCDIISGIKFVNPFVHPSVFGHLVLNTCCNHLLIPDNEIFIDSLNFRINDKFHYSISHTGLYAVAAVSLYKIGIDCLKIEERIASVKEKFLNDEELDIMDSSLEKLTKAFTIKEAAIKCFNLTLLDTKKIIIESIGDDFSNFTYNKNPYSAYHDTIDDYIFTLINKGES